MAHYLTSAPSSWRPAVAFGFMADMRNFERWDPGVHSVTQVEGDGPGLGAAYDVEVRTGPVPMVLRYEVVEWDAPRRVLLVATTPLLRSVDEIRVEPTKTGAVVTYDARLDLRGPLALANPLLALAFGVIGNRAAAGLRAALAGDPPSV